MIMRFPIYSDERNRVRCQKCSECIRRKSFDFCEKFKLNTNKLDQMKISTHNLLINLHDEKILIHFQRKCGRQRNLVYMRKSFFSEIICLPDMHTQRPLIFDSISNEACDGSQNRLLQEILCLSCGWIDTCSKSRLHQIFKSTIGTN